MYHLFNLFIFGLLLNIINSQSSDTSTMQTSPWTNVATGTVGGTVTYTITATTGIISNSTVSTNTTVTSTRSSAQQQSMIIPFSILGCLCLSMFIVKLY
jgi:hypothetical protein